MSTRYFCIENPGEVDLNNLRLLGFSTKSNPDGTERKDMIGQFGSGAKYSFAQLARLKALPIIFSGLIKIQLLVNDNGEILYSIFDPNDPTKLTTIPSSVHLNFGQFDWTDPWYCLRDLICNAIDSAKEFSLKDSKLNPDDYSFHTVNQDKIQGEQNRTRVFIPITAAINMAIQGLESNFVFHLEAIEQNTRGRLLDTGNSKIFKKGVFVRSIPNICWNYDFSDLKLNESRSTSLEFVTRAITQFQHHTGVKYWEKLIQAVVNWSDNYKVTDDNVPFECKGEYSITNTNVKKAFNNLFPKGVICDTDISTKKFELLIKKGYLPIKIKSFQFYQLLKWNDILDYNDISLKSLMLSKDLEDPNPETQLIIDEIVSKVFKNETYNPDDLIVKISSMKSSTKGMYLTVSEYDKPMIIFNKDYIGDNIDFRITIVEEFAHHFSKKTDDSRAFMDYIIKLLIQVMN